MLKTMNLIKAHQSSFPDCGYYLPLLSKARRNASKHPDICIEICKSTLEGISKTIVLGLDPVATKQLADKKDVGQLVKWAVRLLKTHDDVVEDDFVSRATSLANALGALRNVRSDISHGREVPKPDNSSEEFGKLCMQMTDAIASYMLRAFFQAKMTGESVHSAQSESPPVDGDGADPEAGFPQIAYEENLGFNDSLDLDNPLPGKLLYSEALHRLYYEEYLIELEEYRDALALAEVEATMDSSDEDA